MRAIRYAEKRSKTIKLICRRANDRIIARCRTSYRLITSVDTFPRDHCPGRTRKTKKPKTKTRFVFSVLGESDDPRTIGQPLAKKTISNFHCKKGREIENKTHKWSCFYLISYYRNKKAALIYVSPSTKQDSLTSSETKHEQSILKCALHAPMYSSQ